MNTKHSFWSLCQDYGKIEIPIIQRNYAQGRENKDIVRNMDKFVNEYLIDSIINNKKIELDFIYGSVLNIENKDCKKIDVFIPLDGQQRLTTLFLLHWFIALKENRVAEAKVNLTKFTYETRPSAHDFCCRLVEMHKPSSLSGIRKTIEDSEWYDNEWAYDPTITGMLNMIETFSNNKYLMNHSTELFDILIDVNDPLISFYFISLEDFGLTENLYIRMNARGKQLNDFENFKSEFYKIIADSNHLETVKNKIEYDWVDNLWDYKNVNTYIVDKVFMRYLTFITEMLYYKQAEFRADKYETDFLDFKLLHKIYSKENNLNFLIFSFDFISKIKTMNKIDILWSKNSSISDILNDILSTTKDINKHFVLYSTLKYFYDHKEETNFYDYIRVVRNLIENTKENSRREWPKLLKSVENLIQDENIYNFLLSNQQKKILDGFYAPQRNEEIMKAKIIKEFGEKCKIILFNAENDPYLKGNISIIVAVSYGLKENDLCSFNILDFDPIKFKCDEFKSMYYAYKSISADNFNLIWGDLLTSNLYKQSAWDRLTFSSDYIKHPAVIILAKDFKQSQKTDLITFLIEKEKIFINHLYESETDLSCIKNVKEQLYLYYILHTRILKKNYNSFFKKGYNWGWLSKEVSFASIFVEGITGSKYFPNKNPIFQSYSQQFRYNCGLNRDNALDEEIVGNGRKKNPFKLINEWCNNI